MLSNSLVTEEDWYELLVREDLPGELTPQVMKFRVAPVFSFGKEDKIGIWISHYDDIDGGNSYNPVIIDFATWELIDKHVRTRWRERQWELSLRSSAWKKMKNWISGLDIRLA